MAIAKSADHAIKIEALINGILYAQNEGQVLRGFNEISRLEGARPVSTFEAIFSKKNTRNPTIKLAIIAAARNEVNRKPTTAAPSPVVSVTNSRGIPFTVKRVLRGGDTLVEIYDARHNQLVGSWAARTFIQLTDGLNMGHHPDWVLDTDNVATIRTELLDRKTNPVKGNKTMARKANPGSSSEARELYFYIINDADNSLHKTATALSRTVAKKGHYQSGEASKVWARVVLNAAKNYAQEHGSGAASYNKIFDAVARKEATALVENYMRDAVTGHAAELKGSKTMTRNTNPAHGPIRSIDIEAVEWFQKSFGNSYHAVRVSVNGEHVYTSPKTYGYGEHYLTTAAEGLAALGYDIPTRGILWQWARDNGVTLNHYKREVKTERALKEFAAPTPKRKAPSRAKNPLQSKSYFAKDMNGNIVTNISKFDGEWISAYSSGRVSRFNSLAEAKDDAKKIAAGVQIYTVATRDEKGYHAPRRTNPLVKGEHYHVVAVKGGKVAAHWTGTDFDTNKAKAKSYMTKAGATNAANAMAGKLAAGYQVGVQTIEERGGRVTRPKK